MVPIAPLIKAYPAKEVGGGARTRRTIRHAVAPINPIAPIVWRNLRRCRTAFVELLLSVPKPYSQPRKTARREIHKGGVK
jgi:hypothetical protein